MQKSIKKVLICRHAESTSNVVIAEILAARSTTNAFVWGRRIMNDFMLN